MLMYFRKEKFPPKKSSLLSQPYASVTTRNLIHKYMKRALTLIFFAVALIVAAGCDKDTSVPDVQFEQVLYQVCSRSTVSVNLVLSEAPGKSLTVPITFSGPAEKGTEYSVASTSATFAAGSTTASIEITDIAMVDGRTISLTIAGGKGYNVGTKHTCVVSLDTGETLVYDFSAKSVDLYEKATVTMTVKGVTSGSKFRAPSDIEIGFSLSGDDNAVLACEAGNFVIKKGENTATYEFRIKDGYNLNEMVGDEKVKISILGSRYVKGDSGDCTIVVKTGLQMPAKLAGTWVFDHIYDSEELAEWFEMEGDDPSELPLNNIGFTLTFTENAETGAVTLTPSTTGDFAAFFRTATVTLAYPVHMFTGSMLLGNYTASEYNSWYIEETQDADPAVYTYYSLSGANRAFSKTTEILGQAVFSARLVDDDNLIVVLRDYDEPPFGANWWVGSGFDPDMFGFASLFKRQATN